MKKALSIITTFVLVLSMSACSASSEVSEEEEVISSGEITNSTEITDSENASSQEDVSQSDEVKITAEEVLKYFEENDAPDFGDYIVYNEETDTNGLLGRPGEYISKADFAVTSIEATGADPYCATIETFENEQDAIKRYDYISEVYESMSFLKEYMYLNDTVIIRMDYDILPSTEKTYEELLDKYMDSLK